MAIITPCRGHVMRVTPVSGGDNVGFFYIPSLAAKKGDGDALLITGVAPKKSDVVTPIITLENTRILYSFGANFGDISVSGLILLGKSGNPGGSLKTLVDFFESNRVSKKKSPTRVSGPKTAWQVFFTGLQIGEADPVFNTQPFSITGIIAEPK